MEGDCALLMVSNHDRGRSTPYTGLWALSSSVAPLDLLLTKFELIWSKLYRRPTCQFWLIRLIVCIELVEALPIIMMFLMVNWPYLGDRATTHVGTLDLVFLPFCSYIQIEDMYMWNQVI